MQKLAFFLFAFFSICISLYPAAYFISDNIPFLSTKSAELLASNIWNVMFKLHITFGGIALITGWSQFWKSFRTKRLNTHRLLGKIYLISVLVSGIAAIYISSFATGGLVSSAGFFSLGCIWLTTSFLAWKEIKKGNVKTHQKWMIFSYAACFAAVTLRLYLPILASFMPFIDAYKIIAWLCWVPNIFVAFLINRKLAIT